MNAPPELLYIVIVARRSGWQAVVDRDSVIIFKPESTAGAGSHYVGFQVDRVRSLREAWEVLGPGESDDR